MSALPIPVAAGVLGVKQGTLRRWCREGCPHIPGGRGRGRALMVELDAVRTWRGADDHDALILELAQAIPEMAAVATEMAFNSIQNEPAKRRMAGPFTVAWYQITNAVNDSLRERCASVPEVRAIPEAIKRLQKIAKGN